MGYNGGYACLTFVLSTNQKENMTQKNHKVADKMLS